MDGFVNKDDLKDIQDLSELALKYNIGKDNELFIARFDLNMDGIIDVFHIVDISKCLK